MSDYMREIRERVGSRLIEIPAVAVLVFDESGRALLVEHGDVHRWTNPGGEVEPLESPSDAAVREVWEETGLHVELLRVLGVYGGPEFTTTYSNGDAISFLLVLFEGRRISGTPRPDGDETLAVRWVDRAGLETLPTSPWVERVLREAFDHRTRPGEVLPAAFPPPTWSPPRDPQDP